MRDRLTKRYVRTGIKRGIIVTVFRKRQRPLTYLIRHAKIVCFSDGSVDATAASDAENGGACAEETRTDSSADSSAPAECCESKRDSSEDGKPEEGARRSDEEGDRDGDEEEGVRIDVNDADEGGDDSDGSERWNQIREDFIRLTRLVADGPRESRTCSENFPRRASGV